MWIKSLLQILVNKKVLWYISQVYILPEFDRKIFPKNYLKNLPYYLYNRPAPVNEWYLYNKKVFANEWKILDKNKNVCYYWFRKERREK